MLFVCMMLYCGGGGLQNVLDCEVAPMLYHKSIKLLFRYKRCDIVTNILLSTGLPSFSTVIIVNVHLSAVGLTV